jgi:hypothetical protein
MGFICAKWIRLDDGCVARCDKDHTHQGRHLDSIIDICWPDNDPRMKANMPATTAAELVKRVQAQQFELARSIEQRNHAIAVESPFAKGQTIRTPSGVLYKLTKIGGGIHSCPPYGPMVILVGYRLDDEKQVSQQITYYDMEGHPPEIVPEPLEEETDMVTSEAA